MTKRLDKALAAVRRMPPADQDTIAQAMLSMARIAEPGEIDPEHIEDIEEGLAEAARGEFATDEEVAEAFRSFDK